jgi:hypothetical protein
MPFSKSLMGRGEKTLAEYIERKQDAERKKLTFEEWFSNYKNQFNWSVDKKNCLDAWKAAQENV